jgi:hypothetical protein
MKTKLLIAAVIFLALSVAGFAQATFTVGSSPMLYVACCGETESTGEIAFQPRPGSLDTVTGTIMVTYPVRITNPSDINVYSIASDFGGATGVAPVVSGMVDPSDPFKIIIAVGAGGHYPFSINVEGVLVDTSPYPCQFGAVDLKAHVGSTGNLLTSGEQEIIVISQIIPALANPTATTVSFNADTGYPGSATAYYQVGEGFPAAFDDVYMQNVPKLIKLNVSKVPQGIQLSFPVLSIDSSSSSTVDEAGMFQLSTSSGAAVSSDQVITSANSPTSVYYMVAAATDTIRMEYLRIPITVIAVGPYPIGEEPVSITAQMGPSDPTGWMIPRYADAAKCLTADTTLVTVEISTLLLHGGRFAVEVDWLSPTGFTGKGSAVALTSDSGYFWFFEGTNVELLVKIKDGCGVNGQYWFFYGALTDVEYQITVTDIETSAVKTYLGTQHVQTSANDIHAFACP